MLLAFLRAFFKSIAQPVNKKSLRFWWSWYVYKIFGLAVPLFFIFITYLLWYFSFENTTIYIFFIIFAIQVLDIYFAVINQELVKSEKIATLMPYKSIHKFIAIIASFFIFSDTSIISFFIAIFAFLSVLLITIDFKSLAVPKWFAKLFVSEIFCWIYSLATIYFLFEIWIIEFYAINKMTWTIVCLIVLTYKWEWGKFKDLTFDFYKYRLTWVACHQAWDILSFNIMTTFGLILSTLMSFINVIMTNIMSFFILKEVPWKKDIFLSVYVLICVVAWVYFKDFTF